jgi:LmbE family N-acetylglucosaminyl deacetylase
MAPRIMALAAHPDDIEFMMAGTLALLGQAGCELHYMNLANGCCGSTQYDAATTARLRDGEARTAAQALGATFHPPLTDDLAIYYEPRLLARLASVVRDVAPDVLLLPSPQDYMEDHQNTARLGVTAAFCRGMPNYPVDPPRPPIANEVVIYHAQPYGHRDMLNQPVRPDMLVDIGPVIERKTAALALHVSQRQWLDESQGLDSYLQTMIDQAAEIGALAPGLQFAEGWRYHNPLGLCAPGADPLRDLLSERIVRLPAWRPV